MRWFLLGCLAACAAACGNTTTACPLPTDGGPYGPDALPSGECSGDTSCTYLVQEPCSTAQGPVDQWRCTCVSGAWSCAVSVQGNGLCPPADAGTD